jgi:hypothetical protein
LEGRGRGRKAFGKPEKRALSFSRFHSDLPVAFLPKAFPAALLRKLSFISIHGPFTPRALLRSRLPHTVIIGTISFGTCDG